ncbi:MAG: glucose-6-phosphate isomerase [Clostridia bacterium]|nr:glucose-6-phosphate isomerase [Clostridia bacterium]
MVKVDLSGAATFFDAAGPDFAEAAAAHRMLEEKSGPGAEFTGWLNLPKRMAGGGLKPILSAAQKIRSRSGALVVVGIGGSYLGARGAIELLRPVPASGDPKIFFMGNSLSPDRLSDTLEMLGETDFDVNVISKSGTTLEPALGFRAIRALLDKKYGSAAKKHIFATTDAAKGTLHTMAVSEGWDCFPIPDDVGGRYSVLSPVGLLPMAVAGINVSEVISAAVAAFEALELHSPENPAWQYAAARQHLYRHGRTQELLACYEPSFRFMAEWWKQLFGESEGKNGIGIFPASLEYTADLHSMGQYVQDGPRKLFETVFSFESFRRKHFVPFGMGNPDGLNFLAGRDLGDICRIAAEAVKSAHISGGVPNIGVSVPMRDEAGLADLVCFFEFSCAISGYMSGVNPFDQPGVEAYKKNMFRMLGRPGS